MLHAISAIGREAAGHVTVTTTVTVSDAATRPQFDLSSVVSSVTGRPPEPSDVRDVLSGSTYSVVLRVRSPGVAQSGDFLESEACALAPLLVMALEQLLYDMDDEIFGAYVPDVGAATAFSWGSIDTCAGEAAPPSYAHISSNISYNNTSRTTWSVTFGADASAVPTVLFPYDEEAFPSLIDNPDPSATGPDTELRLNPGNWEGNLASVEGVDTRICHTYVSNVRIALGSTAPGTPSICRLDMSYASTHRYNMVYAEVTDYGLDDDRSRLYRYLYSSPKPVLEPGELEALLRDLANTLPPDGPIPAGPPFYRTDAAYGRPINLFDVPDDYLRLRAVRNAGNANDDTVYNPDASRVKYYQKLVRDGGTWDPFGELDLQRLATALFYPPQQYAFEGLRVVSVGSGVIATQLGNTPPLPHWKLHSHGGTVNASGELLDGVYVPVTWHEANGYGLELLGTTTRQLLPWTFRVPSSVSRKYPAYGHPINWYNSRAHGAPPAAPVVTARRDLIPIVGEPGTEYPTPVDYSVLTIPIPVLPVPGTLPGISVGDAPVPAAAVPILREGQPFDIKLKFTQHKWQLTYVGADNGLLPPEPAYWGPIVIEATATAGGCSVNCAGR